MVKDELGSDAVILHTKRYKQGGFLGYKSKEVVEVTAAIDDTPQRPKVKLPPMRHTRAATRPVGPAVPPRRVLAQYKTAGTEEGVSLARSQEMTTARQPERADVDYMEQSAPQEAPIQQPRINPQPAHQVPQRRRPAAQRRAPRGRQPVQGGVSPRTVQPTISQMPQAPQAPQMPQAQPVPRVEPRTVRMAQPYVEPELSYVEPETLPPMEAQQSYVEMAPAQPVMTPQEIQREVQREEKREAQGEIKPEPPRPRIIKAKPRKRTIHVPQDMPVSATVAQPAPMNETAQVAEKNEKIQALEDELAQMRQMLRQVMSQPKSDDEMITLQDAVKAQAVNETVMQDIIRKIPPATLMMPHDSEEAMKALADYLHGAIKAGTGIGLKDGRPKIVALIGTTGVGKTTTIAKISARFVLEKGVSVALITADTYRISAVDQLKTYSDIIGLPLEIVYSAEELKPALRKHKDKQLILIDTAGRSQNNEYQMEELKEFLAVDTSIEKHLVMSATTKERDAEAILERFSAVRPDRMIFTKVDETDTLGFIVNLLFDRRIALSYLTNGQSVPDDIEPARPEALARLLLR